MKLFFESRKETVAVECSSLSHYENVVMSLDIAGSRHEMSVAQGVLSSGAGKIYFSRTGHKFSPGKFGYTKDAGSYESNDPRLIPEPSRLWRMINSHPFETPMMARWEDLVVTAMKPFVMSLQGYNPRGEYLMIHLTPAKLDEVVSMLVKRKILTFV